jgi:hypothetical protein
MLQDRLNGEKNILDKIDLDIILNGFGSRNAQRSFFVKHKSL